MDAGVSALQAENDVILIDTILQYHLSIPNPDDLTLWEWAKKYYYLLEIIKAEKGE